MVGWGDADGDGEWVVTIRCAEAEERTLRLFAGAGIVAGSTRRVRDGGDRGEVPYLLQAMGLGQGTEVQP